MLWRESNNSRTNGFPPSTRALYKDVGSTVLLNHDNKKNISHTKKKKNMPPFTTYKIYKRYGSKKKHGDRWEAQRPHIGKNSMWYMVSPKQRDNQRGRQMTRKRVLKDMATEVVKGYLEHLLVDTMTNYVKQKEIEPLKWEDADITKMVPPIWYPGGVVCAENYRGPKMDYGDHFNGQEAQSKWREKARAEYWCSGEGVEYGHDGGSNPLVRLLYGPFRGKSQWFPLHQAAKRWEAQRQEADREYRRAAAKAEVKDVDGPDGQQPQDADGFLLFPHEDDVPYRAQSSSDEEEIAQ